MLCEKLKMKSTSEAKTGSLGKKDKTQRYDSPSSSNAGYPLFSHCALTAYRLSTREGEGSLPGRKISSESVLRPGCCKGLARDEGQSHLCWTHHRYTDSQWDHRRTISLDHWVGRGIRE